MASLRINSGDLEGDEYAKDVPKDRWPKLLERREWFCQVTLTADCRRVAQFVREAELMFDTLGFQSADDLISRGYGLEPDEIRLVAQWLELNDPQEAVPLSEALEKSQALAAKAKGVQVLNPNGVNQHTLEGCDKTQNVTPLTKERGNSAAYRIAKLKRDHPDVAARMESGEFKTVAEAERAAGVGRPLQRPEVKYRRQLQKLEVDESISRSEKIRMLRESLRRIESQ